MVFGRLKLTNSKVTGLGGVVRHSPCSPKIFRPMWNQAMFTLYRIVKRSVCLFVCLFFVWLIDWLIDYLVLKMIGIAGNGLVSVGDFRVNTSQQTWESSIMSVRFHILKSNEGFNPRESRSSKVRFYIHGITGRHNFSILLYFSSSKPLAIGHDCDLAIVCTKLTTGLIQISCKMLNTVKSHL